MSNCDDENDCHIETIDGMIILQSTPAAGAMISKYRHQLPIKYKERNWAIIVPPSPHIN